MQRVVVAYVGLTIVVSRECGIFLVPISTMLSVKLKLNEDEVINQEVGRAKFHANLNGNKSVEMLILFKMWVSLISNSGKNKSNIFIL
jgi:hypothetical protein